MQLAPLLDVQQAKLFETLLVAEAPCDLVVKLVMLDLQLVDLLDLVLDKPVDLGTGALAFNSKQQTVLCLSPAHCLLPASMLAGDHLVPVESERVQGVEADRAVLRLGEGDSETREP